MKYLILNFFLAVTTLAQAQALRDINYNYSYNPENDISFQIKSVKSSDSWTVFYQLILNDTTKSIGDYDIEWEKRNSVSDKEGNVFTPESINMTVLKSGKNFQRGKINIPFSNEDQALAAKVINKTFKQASFYFTILTSNYPVNAYLKDEDDNVIFNDYINRGQSVTVQSAASDDRLIISYYNDFFPTAAPAFSEGQAQVAKEIKTDSTFTVTANQAITLKKVGLYLVQKDTASTAGFAFRVEEEGYPKFRRIQDLVGPFIYICTRQEFERLRLTGSDKKNFDKEVLGITKDRDRARDFMRTYFKRAEAANQYFSSYKEGWKTDRGMMYIIYGLPDKVYKFADREVWTYGKDNFTFAKSGTLFDPDNYVLIRNKKYTEDWYEKVDLVRNSRF